MDGWIVDVISFQKIFGLCGLKCHIMEIWRDVTLVHGQRRTTDGRTECEDSARILETEFSIVMNKTAVICANSVFTGFFSTRISLTVSVYILNCEYQIRIIST